MIQKTNSFRTSDGSIYSTVEQAQRHELEVLVNEALTMATSDDVNDLSIPMSISRVFLDKRSQVIDILTTTETSRPTARKLHGGRKKKRSLKQHELALT